MAERRKPEDERQQASESRTTSPVCIQLPPREKSRKGYGRTSIGKHFRILEGGCSRKERQSDMELTKEGCVDAAPPKRPRNHPRAPNCLRAQRKKPGKCSDRKPRGVVGRSTESDRLRRERQSGGELTKRGLRYGTPERPHNHNKDPRVRM